jgi:hypothetical protein
MVTEAQFIIGGALFFWVLYTYLWKRCFYDEDSLWFFGIIGSFIFAVSSMIILLEIDDKETETYYKYYCNIHSLKNSNDVSGSFVLGSGSIEQVEYYYYYYKDVNGYFKRGKKEVRGTVIEEKEGVIPHIERLYTKYESRTGFVKSYMDHSCEEYKIVVPKGSVINKFEIY